MDPPSPTRSSQSSSRRGRLRRTPSGRPYDRPERTRTQTGEREIDPQEIFAGTLEGSGILEPLHSIIDTIESVRTREEEYHTPDELARAGIPQDQLIPRHITLPQIIQPPPSPEPIIRSSSSRETTPGLSYRYNTPPADPVDLTGDVVLPPPSPGPSDPPSHHSSPRDLPLNPRRMAESDSSDKNLLRKPTPYDGDKARFKTFKREVSTYIMANPNAFRTNEKKILFVQSYLTSGPAKDWAQQYYNENIVTQWLAEDPSLEEFSSYWAKVEGKFDDKDKKKRALQRIQALRQGSATVQQ